MRLSKKLKMKDCFPRRLPQPPPLDPPEPPLDPPWTPPGPPWISSVFALPSRTPAWSLEKAPLSVVAKVWITPGLGAFANAMSMPWLITLQICKHIPMRTEERTAIQIVQESSWILRNSNFPCTPTCLSDQSAERRKKEFRKLNPKRRSW